ncbi:hypothetical protein SDC9_105609 [bioreactor metagenome]|uniref:Uncharacterized protein n=1 Tax=bioreactor metagenome TaxID=1076179 RepID=A0A645B137_9ZZZZ
MRQKDAAVFRLGVECLLDGLLVPREKEAAALLQDVGQHQNGQIIMLLRAHPVQGFHKLRLPGKELPGVGAGDLGHAKVVPRDVELLEVRHQKLLRRVGFTAGNGENHVAQLIQGNPGKAGHAVCHVDVPLGAGGGFEHNRVGQNGRGHQPRHLLRGHQAPVLIHPRHNGGGAAHRLVSHVDGIPGLDVRQTVVVDDFQNLRLFQSPDGLSRFIVVHQNHPLARRAQQVEAGQGPHHLFFLVQNGITAEAAFQNRLPHVVDIIVQMEAYKVFCFTDAVHRQGKADQPHRAVGVIGRGNQARLRLHGPQLLAYLRLAYDQTLNPQLHGIANHVRLVAADHDAVLRIKH